MNKCSVGVHFGYKKLIRRPICPHLQARLHPKRSRVWPRPGVCEEPRESLSAKTSTDKMQRSHGTRHNAPSCTIRGEIDNRNRRQKRRGGRVSSLVRG